MADTRGNMVERVARAIYEHALDAPNWEALEPGAKGAYVSHARAAIEAMRTPTEEMKRAGDETGCFVCSDEDVSYRGREAGFVYTAMIDAILKEGD